MPAMTGVLSILSPRLLTGASVDQTVRRGRQVTDDRKVGCWIELRPNLESAQMAGYGAIRRLNWSVIMCARARSEWPMGQYVSPSGSDRRLAQPQERHDGADHE